MTHSGHMEPDLIVGTTVLRGIEGKDFVFTGFGLSGDYDHHGGLRSFKHMNSVETIPS